MNVSSREHVPQHPPGDSKSLHPAVERAVPPHLMIFDWEVISSCGVEGVCLFFFFIFLEEVEVESDEEGVDERYRRDGRV